MKKLAYILVLCIVSMTSCTGTLVDTVDELGTEISEVSYQEHNMLQLVIDGVSYGSKLTIAEFDKNGWRLNVGMKNSMALKKLLNEGSGSVKVKCYNDKYTERINGNLEYNNDNTFTIDMIYTLLSYDGNNVDGYITEVSILNYDLHDRCLLKNCPIVEYGGIKFGDSYGVVKKVLGIEDSEQEGIFIERTWEYDNGNVILSFDREKDTFVGIKYSVTKI